MSEDWLQPGVTSSGAAAEVKAGLIAAYAEPHRRYHDMTHIADGLAQLRAVEGLTDDERTWLAYAIWWHDAVYDPTRSDNEAQSAALARRDLALLGEPAQAIAEVSPEQLEVRSLQDYYS